MYSLESFDHVVFVGFTPTVHTYCTLVAVQSLVQYPALPIPF